jgi:Serine/threonine protein kinase
MAEFDDTTGNRTPTPVAEPSSRPHVEIGETIDERYKITSFLGEGGMAMVFQVERLHFNDVCAMKVGKHTLSQVSGQRFHKEAIAACSLEHPNLLRVYDFGIVKEQYPYFVMDFVDGETLQRYLRHNGPLCLPPAMEIFTQVCEGMAYAHKKGIVHRDLKPGNIMLIKKTTPRRSSKSSISGWLSSSKMPPTRV